MDRRARQCREWQSFSLGWKLQDMRFDSSLSFSPRSTDFVTCLISLNSTKWKAQIKNKKTGGDCYLLSCRIIFDFCFLSLLSSVNFNWFSQVYFSLFLEQVLDIISHFSLWVGLINPGTTVLVSSALGANMDANLSL